MLKTIVFAQGFIVTLTPDTVAALIAIVVSIASSTALLWAGFVKVLPGILERREKLREAIEQSKLDDQADHRKEEEQQRQAENEYRQSLIKQTDAQLVLLTQLIEATSQNAASWQLFSKESAVQSQAIVATAKALTDNTVELSVNSETMRAFTEQFLQTFRVGSEPVQHIASTVDDMVLHGVKPDEAARAQLSRIEQTVCEINDKVMPCVEAQTTMNHEMVEVLSEARRLIELFNRDAQLKIEDKRKTDSRPIPPINEDVAAA